MTLSPRVRAILTRTRAAMDSIAELLNARSPKAAPMAGDDHPPIRPRAALDRTHPVNISRTALRTWRRERRLCSECGAELLPAEQNLCAYHSFIRAEASDRWRKKHPDEVKAMNLRPRVPAKVNARQRAGYQRRLAAKTCTACKSPPLPGLKVCQKHRDANRAKIKRYQDRTRKPKTAAGSATALPASRRAA